MGLAFGGQAGKPFSQQKSIAAFHVDRIFDKASCNGWGDAYAFGDPSSANFAAEGRRELLCGQTEAGPFTERRALFVSARLPDVLTLKPPPAVSRSIPPGCFSCSVELHKGRAY
jgi:hypothetical protein